MVILYVLGLKSDPSFFRAKTSKPNNIFKIEYTKSYLPKPSSEKPKPEQLVRFLETYFCFVEDKAYQAKTLEPKHIFTLHEAWFSKLGT